MKGRSFSRFGLSFRAAEPTDAEFILLARRSPLAAPFLSYTDPSVERQRQWILQQNHRPDDYYFIVEDGERREIGTVGLYDISHHQAEWGRFIVLNGSAAALACALSMFYFAFDELRLKTVSSWTMLENTKTVMFHDRLGLPKIVAHRPVKSQEGERTVSFAQHVMHHDRWPSVEQKWAPIAKQSEHFL